MTSKIPKVMRAVVCPSVPIPPSGLVYTEDHPVPSPKPGHVLIRIKAFGLNRSEILTRQGHSPGLEFPRVLGIECVGEVKDAGEGSMWKEGDVVAAIMGGMGRLFDGGYAEYTLVPHKNVSPPIKLPENLGWAEFAAIPETFMTAWGTLESSLKLTPDDTLLIRGGTTSLGLATATLAKSLFSNKNIISTTRSNKKVGALKSAGVDETILDSGNISDEVMKITNGKGVDKCMELIGGTTVEDSLRSLGPEGVISMVGCVSGVWTVKEFDWFTMLAPHKHVTVYTSEEADLSTAPLQKIIDAVASGKIKLALDKVFKMEDAGLAHQYMEDNGAAGKVVCAVD